MTIWIQGYTCDNCRDYFDCKDLYSIDEEEEIIKEAQDAGWGYTYDCELVCPQCMKNNRLKITRKAKQYTKDMEEKNEQSTKS